MTISDQWLAGFFDGEGCISATVAGKYRRVILRLSLVNTDVELMRAIADQYHGQFVHRKTTHAHWKRACHVIWTNTQAELLLERIGDFIILKSQQVALARQFLSMRRDPERFTVRLIPVNNHRSGTRPVKVVSDTILQREEDIKQQFHILNRKGVAVAV